MAINLYSKASVDSLLTAKLSISSLTNAAATTLNATAPTTDQVLSFDGTELKWATVSGGGGLTISTLSNGATSTLNATAPTTGQALTFDGTVLKWSTISASASWGSITGTLSSQTDLNTALGLKAPLASPTFTGTPSAPTATAGTSTTQIATTAFVTAVDILKAPLASPTFTGVPAAPTATAGTNTTQLATTAFVTTADNLKANLASPTFTGDPKAPTPATSDNDTSIATTAFVKAQGYVTSSALSVYALLSGTSQIQVTGNAIKSLDGSDNFAALDQGVLNFGNGSTPSGIVINGSSITFADYTVQTSAGATESWVLSQGYITNPSADFMMANAIASLIYSQGANSYGDLSFSNVPQFLTALGTSWGIVDGSAFYYNCTGFSGSSYSLSGTAGSGPYYVQVNGTNSAFSF